MSESDFWLALEFRLEPEFQGMIGNHLRYRWCDSFVPEQYFLDDQSPRITGHAWICNDLKQDIWAFTLLLNGPITSRAEIDWSSLLPPLNVTKWLGVDIAGKRIEIEPSAAVPDLI